MNCNFHPESHHPSDPGLFPASWGDQDAFGHAAMHRVSLPAIRRSDPIRRSHHRWNRADTQKHGMSSKRAPDRHQTSSKHGIENIMFTTKRVIETGLDQQKLRLDSNDSS